ncbi:LysM peptidoglycan-binding domain-containing protein [Serpentinicella alkaliphila]|uniref:Peptidoglycan/xylan/chitin deacetylase (PgdA/CDA1 family) n=1 Tax=Serpentinicella alkaliphila TaxID=1734049 RepID=A0A4R2TLZ8_9FIRM|nr:LysM peptidoglycan-binding domain-containing protein [Serpentinicella alkaliphila]QUH24572.1 LysM peptidoglycan-binding domain-containing protein [Serpentinicella alkaliphila]TCQ04668.1 peptidoglycan/xylan/chitin deacetylase (PgdA/CDA1 family) [Serpentinicella alkaliphila]
MLVGLFIFPYTASAAQVHRVAPGESLFMIAQRHGVTVNAILTQNKYLRNHNTIFPKQVLIIPQTHNNGIYIVQPGDTLFKISEKLGVTVEAIASENQITNINNLFVGQSLKVPTNTSQTNTTVTNNTYTVKAGDSLFKISQQLGVSMEAIAKENQLSNWNNIFVGQNLKIPNNDTNQTQTVSDEYVVKPGDTLFKISQDLAVPMNDLVKENNITNVNLLFVGQVLNIPNKVVSQPPSSPQHSVSQLARMYPDTLFMKGTGNGNKIALTFDDGPNPTYTPQLLDVLKRHNVPATFFVMGSRVERHPAIAQRIVNEGHVIANHTWIHPNLRNVSQSQLVTEMTETENIIQKVTGVRTALMRPPYGGINQQALEGLRDLNYKVIHWSIDSVDWRDQEVDTILINSLSPILGNDIILFHDAGGDEQTRGATVEGIEEIIITLRSQGYEFVTVDNLLGVKAYR